MCRDRPDGATVGHGLVHREVEPVVAPLGLRAIERALAAASRDPAAGGTLPRFVLRPVLVEEHVDPGVGGRLERLGPPGRRALAATRALAPALDQSRLLGGARLLEDRARQLEQVLSRRVRLGGRPPDDGVLRLGGEHLLELRPRFLGRDDDQLRRGHPPDAAVDVLRHLLQVLRDELLDMALEARLRPPALVVPAGHLVAPVDDLVEASGPEPEELAPLAADDCDERPIAAPDQRHERRKMELPADPDAVRHRLDQGAGLPHVVEARGKEREPVRPVAIELVREPLADPLEIALERDALVVGEAAVRVLGVALAVAQERTDPRGGVARRRSRARVQIDVQADRTALLGPERSQRAKPIPAHRLGHRGSFPAEAAILKGTAQPGGWAVLSTGSFY